MTIIPPMQQPWKNGYPTSDGKQESNPGWRGVLRNDLIFTLQAFFADQPRVYVSGNLMLF